MNAGDKKTDFEGWHLEQTPVHNYIQSTQMFILLNETAILPFTFTMSQSSILLQ